MRRSSRSGFTLIEIMIVISIIAILIVVLLAVVISARKKGDVAKAKDFCTNVIPTAISKWQDDKGKNSNTYPASPKVKDGASYSEGTANLFEELVTKPKKNGKDAYISESQYLEGTEAGKSVFMDPWNHFYIYRNYTAKKTVSGHKNVYTGRRYNDNTYDIISLGPDGQLYEPKSDDGTKGENDDIYNGVEE